MDRNSAKIKHNGAELKITEAIQDTASVRDMITGAYSICHASFLNVRLETRGWRDRNPEPRVEGGGGGSFASAINSDLPNWAFQIRNFPIRTFSIGNFSIGQ